MIYTIGSLITTGVAKGVYSVGITIGKPLLKWFIGENRELKKMEEELQQTKKDLINLHREVGILHDEISEGEHDLLEWVYVQEQEEDTSLVFCKETLPLKGSGIYKEVEKLETIEEEKIETVEKKIYNEITLDILNYLNTETIENLGKPIILNDEETLP